MVRKYDEKLNTLAIENAKLKQLIAGDTREPSPRSTRQFEVPKYGVGGYLDQPFDDFGDYRGPAIRNPNPGQLFPWANQMMINNKPIAHRSHKPNTRDYHNPAQHNAPVDPGGNPIKRSPSNKHLFPTHREIDERNKGHWNVDPENYTPDGMLISSTPEFYKKENIGGTLMDVVLPLLIQKYGKGPDGKYKDPDKLIEMMGKLRGV